MCEAADVDVLSTVAELRGPLEDRDVPFGYATVTALRSDDGTEGLQGNLVRAARSMGATAPNP